MKILLYCNSFLPKIDGQVNRIRIFLDYIEEFKNHDIILITPDKNCIDNYKRFRILKVDNISIQKLLNIPFDNIFSCNIFNLFKFYSNIKNICKNEKIDIIHIYQGDFSTNIFNLISLEMNIPIIYSFHTDLIKYLKYYDKSLLSKNYKYIYKLSGMFNCDKFLTVSHNAKNELLKIKDHNISIYPYCIDHKQFFYKYSKSKEINSRELKLIFIGRLDKEKNLDILINIMKKISNCSLIIIGDGNYKEILIKNSSNLNITFTGFIDNSELNDYLNEADIFINPSKTETLGQVTLEAMTSGTPIIASNDGGTLDIIKDNYNGLLYNTENDLINKIELLRSDDILRNNLIKNGLNYCKDFTTENYCNFIINLYNSEIIEKKKNNRKYNYINLILYIIVISLLYIAGKINNLYSLIKLL